jgi:hypothetical protein
MPSARKPSEDSLYDPSYPEVNHPSASQARRSSFSSSSGSGSDAASDAESDDSSPPAALQRPPPAAVAPRSPGAAARAPAPAPASIRDRYRQQSVDVSPTAVTGPRAAPSTEQTGGWGVAISPSRNATYRAPAPIPTSPIRAPAPAPTSPIRRAPSTGPSPRIASPIRADPDNDEYTHLPSFTAPSPTRPGYAFRKASMTIPAARPALGTTNSSAPLMGDSSAVNTPATLLGDPFSDRLQAGLARAPSSERPPMSQHSGQASIPPRIHINSIPNSPATPGAGAVPTALPFAASSPYGAVSPVPTSNASAYNPSQDTFGAPVSAAAAVTRRPSQAGTVGTQLSAVSVASGMDSRGGRLTAAERRNQRMKQVMGKKGKKEREVKGATGVQINRKPFQSTRLKEEIYKPWLEKKDPAQRWARWITLFSIFIGLAVMAVSE